MTDKERTEKRTETHACDLIKRQDAIDALSNMMDIDGFRDGWAVSRANVNCMLRSLPSVQPDHIAEGGKKVSSSRGQENDLISRQMLLEYIHGEPVGKLLCDKYNLDGLVEQFPSAQPERKTGRWVSYLPEGLRYKCSECGSKYETPWHYCPNCGLPMIGGDGDALD